MISLYVMRPEIRFHLPSRDRLTGIGAQVTAERNETKTMISVGFILSVLMWQVDGRWNILVYGRNGFIKLVDGS